MKNLLSLALILSIALLFSCGDDDGPSVNSEGQLSFDGETAALTHAYIEDYGENDNGSFDVDITLTSKAVDLGSESISNVSVVYLDLNTSIQNVLEAGTYTYTDGDRDEFKMVDGFVAINASFDSEGNTSGKIFEVTGGTVTVTRSSGVYNISFTLTGDNDERATGSYNGALTPYEDTDD
ncbi:hypothetical protein [Ekhidna sp.]|uniref:hypothetical protein n=1 Tax=Ekhidna sp. TaxID=2608089 RepID=UPI003CCC0B9A